MENVDSKALRAVHEHDRHPQDPSVFQRTTFIEIVIVLHRVLLYSP
jgi:hypothetical protein